MDPAPAGLSDQVTAVLAVLVTVAVNCWVPPAGTDARPGVSVTATDGMRVMVDVSGVELTPSVVAVTVTDCCVAMLAGAV